MRFALPALLAAALVTTGCTGVFTPAAATSYVIEQNQSDVDREMAAFAAVTTVGAAALVYYLVKKRAQDGAQETPVAPVASADADANARLERLFVQGRVLTAEGNCAAVHGLGLAVARTAPEMAVAFTSDPAIAPCYADAR